jgi:hypothetical protein
MPAGQNKRTGVRTLERLIGYASVLYTRVSTKDKGQATDNQLRELRAFTKLLGYTV